MIRKWVVLVLCAATVMVSCAKKEESHAVSFPKERKTLQLCGFSSSTKVENSDSSINVSTAVILRTAPLETQLQNKLASFEYDVARDAMVWDMVNADADFSSVQQAGEMQSGVDQKDRWWGFVFAGGPAAVDVPVGSSPFVKEYELDSENVERSYGENHHAAAREAVFSKYPDRKEGKVSGVAYITGARLEPGEKNFRLWLTFSVFVN